MLDDPLKPFWSGLFSWLLQLFVGTAILIVALSVKGSSTPMAPFYLSGAVFFGMLAGQTIERWRRNRQ